MELNEVFRLKKPSRQAKARAWIALAGTSCSEMAKVIGVHPSVISDMLAGRIAPAKHINALVDRGFPARYLPKPNENSRLGRKPATDAQAAA